MIYLVFWMDLDGVSHNETVASKAAAHRRVLELRAKGFNAGWDLIDPMNSDTAGGVR